MTRDLFGTDGIRGKAYKYPLDEHGSQKVGQAIGEYFKDFTGQTILIGRDTRESSPMIAENVSIGIRSTGIKVISLEVVPTAGLAYLSQKTDAKAGVMITASHNPYEDNGIKVFSASGAKLPDDTESKLNELIDSELSDQTSAPFVPSPNLIDHYVRYLIDSAGDANFKDIALAIDCANGATSYVAEYIFSKLGFNVTTLFKNPDGKNINDDCGATHTHNIQQYVTEHDMDVGIAFDGDGDRVMLIDKYGRVLNGDQMLFILAVTMKVQGVVATVMSNIGLENELKKRGIGFIRTQVGDRYVLEGMTKSRFKIGGEQSGHIIIRELSSTGDGILTAIQVLKQVKSSGKPLHEWYDELYIWPQKLVNIPLYNKELLNDVAVKAYIDYEKSAFSNKGRLNIRPSGTESLLRVMVESKDADEDAHKIADRLSKLISDAELK